MNDGYGCGYTSRGILKDTRRGLEQVGIRSLENYDSFVRAYRAA